MAASWPFWLVTWDSFPPLSDDISYILKLETATLSLQGCTSSVQYGIHLNKILCSVCLLFALY